MRIASFGKSTAQATAFDLQELDEALLLSAAQAAPVGTVAPDAAAAQPAAEAPLPADPVALGLESTTVAGYTASTNTKEWNIKAIFGSDPNLVLKQFNGQGVHIGIFDDGIDKTHAALKTAYDATRELKLSGIWLDPSTTASGATSSTGTHGTAVAGIIAADATTNGGTDTGLAYGASITSVNIYNGWFYSEIAQMYRFDVTNNSYGWTSKWVDSFAGGIGSLEWSAYKTAATSGRGGLGTVIVAAAGNGWSTHTETAHTEMGSSRWVIDVGATLSTGDVASYSTRGSNVLVSAPTGVYTTDRTGTAGYSSSDYYNGFAGTSAAAPEVTAVVADMLSADGKLGWRDIQEILAITANDTQVADTAKFTTAASGNMAYGWLVNHAVYDQVNGGGLHFSNDVGYGQVDGHAAIREAEVWHYFSSYETSANEIDVAVKSTATAALSAGKVATFALAVTKAESVENVSLTLALTTKNLNGLKIELISPSGTDSILLDPASGTKSASGLTWTFASHAFLGESSVGTWTVKVTDSNATDTGSISGVTLDLYGSAVSAQTVHHYTDDVFSMLAYDSGRLTLHDTGSAVWVDTAPMTGGTLALDLLTGHSSTMNGKTFLTIGSDTVVKNVTVADGVATVTANAYDNIVVAGHGTDTVSLGAGNDTLYAGYGVLVATGGTGSDTFAFGHGGFGSATITDFQNGTDHIDLRGLGASFAGLKITDTGSTIKVVVDAAGDSITLTDTANRHLTASDFLFA